MPTVERWACRLAFDLFGSGPPILFLQGVGVHGRGWLPQIERLSARWQCLTFDNRGIGRSQPAGESKLTIECMVLDALALADAMGWSDFHVVGHSMGGHIALELALAETPRVRSLTLMCTSARGRDMPPLTARFLWSSLRSRIGTRRARRCAFLEIVLPRSLRVASDLEEWSTRLEPLFGHDLADTPAITLQQIRAYRAVDAIAQLGSLRAIPTLVVSATEDPLSPPPLGRALADGLPGARWVEIANASHGAPITHADEIHPILEQHLTSAEKIWKEVRLAQGDSSSSSTTRTDSQ